MTKAWTFVFLYAAVIFGISSISRPPIYLDPRIEILHPDWIFHVLEYGLFGYLLARAFAITHDFHSPIFLLLAVIVVGSLYGATDEWHQSFVSGRDSNAEDWIVDTLGVSIGSLQWISKKRKAVCLK